MSRPFKLTLSQCAEIREIYLRAEHSIDELAELFECGPGPILDAINGVRDGICITPRAKKQIRNKNWSRLNKGKYVGGAGWSQGAPKKKVYELNKKTRKMYSIAVPEEIKEDLIRMHKEQLFQTEIAMALGIGQGTVSRYLRRLRLDGELA